MEEDGFKAHIQTYQSLVVHEYVTDFVVHILIEIFLSELIGTFS